MTNFVWLDETFTVEQVERICEMAEQGRIRPSMTTETTVTPAPTVPRQPKPTDEEVNELLEKESDPVIVEKQTDNTIKHMQSVFTAMKKHFDAARTEAQKLPNSDELAALLAHLNMAEVAMDSMVSQAEGSLV